MAARGVQRPAADGETRQWRVHLRRRALVLENTVSAMATDGADAAWWMRRLADDRTGRPSADDFALTLRWLQEARDRMDYEIAGVLDVAYAATQASWADLATFGYSEQGTRTLRERHVPSGSPDAPFRPRIHRGHEPSAGNILREYNGWKVLLNATEERTRTSHP